MLYNKLFVELKPGKWLKANYNEIAKSLIGDSGHNPFIDPHECTEMVNQLHEKFNTDYSYGGWMEDRKDIWKGKGHTLHVGVDYSVPAYTEVTVPCPAKLIERFWDADQKGGWGGRLLFEAASGIYFLFAHLDWQGMVGGARHYRFDMDQDRLSKCKVGDIVQPGEVVGHLGTPDVNGGWFPHLHVQCMTKVNMKEHRLGIWEAYLKHYDGIEKDYPDPEVEATWTKS